MTKGGAVHGEAGGSSAARVSAVLWLGARRQLAIRVGNGAVRARLLFIAQGILVRMARRTRWCNTLKIATLEIGLK